MKFGANTFIWTSPFTNDSLPLIAKVREMGFDTFELVCEEPATIDGHTIKSALQDQGLAITVCGAFSPDRDLSSADKSIRENGQAYIRWCIDAAQALGSPLFAGPMYASVGKVHPLTQAEFEAERRRSVQEMRALAEYAGDHGVKLAIEPLNRFETDLINITEQGLAYVEEVGSPHVGLLLDTFHMHLEEKNTEAAIIQAADRLFHFHASENDRGVPGTGQVNWEGVARGLKAIGYDDAVVIESFTPEVKSIARAVCIWRKIAPDQDTIARQGLEFLRSLLCP